MTRQPGCSGATQGTLATTLRSSSISARGEHAWAMNLSCGRASLGENSERVLHHRASRSWAGVVAARTWRSSHVGIGPSYLVIDPQTIGKATSTALSARPSEMSSARAQHRHHQTRDRLPRTKARGLVRPFARPIGRRKADALKSISSSAVGRHELEAFCRRFGSRHGRTHGEELT